MHDEHPRASYRIVLELMKGAVGVAEGERDGCGTQGNLASQAQKLPAVGPGVGGDAAQLALVEEMALVVE